MELENENKKKRKRIGMMSSGLFLILLAVILYAFEMKVPAKNEPLPIITLDFSGSVKKGGSGSKAKSAPTKEVTTLKAEPVKTQKTKSATQKTSGKKSSSKSSSKKPNRRALADGAFGGNNNGKGSGNSNGDGGGLGTGDSGPGLTGKIGKLTRGAVNNVTANNPIEEEGQVAVEITVNQSGKVIAAKALRTHSYTTSNNPAHYAAAEKAARKYRFSANPNAKEFEKGVVKIKFTLQ